MRKSSDTGTINRVLALLAELAINPETTAKEAAERLEWPVSTTHRLLQFLVNRDFARQIRRGVFGPGMEFYRIAGRLGTSVPYVQLAAPLLRALTDRYAETSMLTVLMRHHLGMYFAFVASPPDPMRYAIELHRVDPLPWGASGRAILAFMNDEEVDEAIRTCGKLSASGKRLDADELRADLRRIRKKGFALASSQRTLNSVGIAVPIFDGRNEVVGCVAFQLPQFRFRPQLVSELSAALQKAAAQISRQLGSSYVYATREKVA